MKEGIVIKSTGSWYEVKMTNGSAVKCRIIGKFKIKGLRMTNPVAVGDKVKIKQEEGLDTWLIKDILPRENYVVRQSPRKKHEVHLLASNVDQAMVIVTIVEPKLKQGFIDRFLLMTEPYDIPTTIVFNKMDLHGEEEKAVFEFLKSIYEPIGYNVMLISATAAIGIDELKSHLSGKTTLVSGQSGVGKSSIINALIPKKELRTTVLSDYSGKGQHTTTFAEMFEMDAKTSIIDTPGIKTLSFNHFTTMDVAHNFREFFEISSECKFGGSCLHRQEPKCAVKDAIEAEELSELRYFNYLQLIEEVEDQNYWERRKEV